MSCGSIHLNDRHSSVGDRRHLLRGRAGAVRHQVHLGRLRRGRVDQRRTCCRRATTSPRARAGHRRELRRARRRRRHRVDVALARMHLGAGDVERLPVGRQRRPRRSPICRCVSWRRRMRRPCRVDGVEVHPAVALRQEPDVLLSGSQPNDGSFGPEPADLPHPRVVVQRVEDAASCRSPDRPRPASGPCCRQRARARPRSRRRRRTAACPSGLPARLP